LLIYLLCGEDNTKARACESVL